MTVVADQLERSRNRRRWLAVVVLCVGQLMIVLDGTVVNVALPVIERQLRFSQASLAWVVNAYLLTFAGLLLLAGRLGDLLGQKRVFLFGLGLFTVASALCGFSDSSAMLVAARFLQGIGAAFASSMVLGILVNLFPKPYERARAMSVYAFVANAGGSIGLLVGGALTQALSWHWIFFVNVPIGLVGIVLAVVLIDGKEGIGIHAGVDLVGTSLVVVAPTLAVYAIVSSSNAGWGSPRTLGLFVLTIVLGALFVLVERRVARPLIPFSIFRSRNLRGADIVRFFHGFAMSTIFFIGALYLEDVLHLGAFTTGLAYLPSNVVLGVCSLFLMTRLVRRFGPHRLLLPGFAAITLALALLSRAPSEASYVGAVLPSFLLVGLGASLVFMPSVTIAMSDARPDQSGLASGLTNVTLQIGSAFGVAVVASVSTVVSRTELRRGEPVARALTAGYHAGFVIATASAIVAGILGYLLLVRPAASEPSPAAHRGSLLGDTVADARAHLTPGGSSRLWRPDEVARDEGVSPTPLWRKLGLHEGDAVALIDAPDEFDLPDPPARLVIARESATAAITGPTDVVLAFFRQAADLEPALGRLAPRIFPDGALWIAWPRRAAGYESDLGDVVVRDTALGFGLVDVKVAALGHDWSGLRFVWRKGLRRPTSAPGAAYPPGTASGA